MRSFFKKSLAMILSVCIVLMNLGSTNIARADDADKENEIDYKVVETSDDLVTVMTEYKGDELYATLDKTTNEVTLETVEKPKSLLKNGEEKRTKYRVEVEEAHTNGYILATVIDDKSKEKIKIEKGENKGKEKIDKEKEEENIVVAQIPLLAGAIIEWGAAGLLAALFAEAASIAIAGIIAYEIAEAWEEMNKSKYDYWTANLDEDKTDVFIGPAIPNRSAAIEWIQVANSEENNVWARTKDKAIDIAKNSGKIETYI
ncbi:hypothetical protein [Bacillus sp. SM2101]|uniref:hypothetical protein n=1 Tax=Bacillus sp. SM2101 TaxID=2805366 RepID=UPI001BDF3E61|nr:hypothetical protein [Bacillus sp. SM2101]